MISVTLKNDTGESLTDGLSAAIYGQWDNFPSSISPHSSSSFVLTDTTWFTGSEGTFFYKIRDADRYICAQLKTYQTGPYNGENEISYTPLEPKALYTCSFRARVGNGDWTYNYVETSGYPVTVEYTIQYQRKLFKFEVNEITATSKHPVRNSRMELIAGNHTLWNRSNPSIHPDGNRGSFQPNVFAYTFGSKVAETGILDVKVRPLDFELVGAEVILFGTIDGQRVIQSGYFFFKSPNEVTVRAHVVIPVTSTKPFSLNADVDWGMELRLSNQPLQRVGEGITRLELYWIATTVHLAFQAYIPVSFLRNILKTTATVWANNFEFYQDMTKMVFSDYHKRYDTTNGASWFGMSGQGGNFLLDLYLLADDSNQPGSLFPYVNCMDQTAILELSCSLLGGFFSTSWLYQMPFGYINKTHLVGIKNAEGALIDVNNPFFGTDSTRAFVDINDPGRTGFGIHVYVGHSDLLDIFNDGVYDGCGGPHIGDETIADYVQNAIDTQANLYLAYNTHPGTIDHVDGGVGVFGINGEFPGLQLQRIMAPLTEPLSRLVNTAVADTMRTMTHVDWARLPTWLNATLGDAWDVQYEHITVSEAEAQAIWYISNTNARDSPLRVHVDVYSVIAQDGHLDMEESAVIARERIGHILMSTERDGIWTSRTLPDLEEGSLQYADHVAAGRIVVITGNVVMDISGMTSSEVLLPYALKLLNRTARRDRSALAVPVLKIQVIRMGIDTDGATTLSESDAAMGIISVTGIDTRFSVVFSVGCEIAAARAACDGTGVLFDRHTVDELGNGEGRTVEFFFIVREVGYYCVHMYVADLETMLEATSALNVEVISPWERV